MSTKSDKNIDMYVLVHWIEDKPQTYAVQRQDSVMDKDMLQNPDLSGLVKWTGLEAKEPKGGWAEHPAKVVAVSGRHASYLSQRSFLDIISQFSKLIETE